MLCNALHFLFNAVQCYMYMYDGQKAVHVMSITHYFGEFLVQKILMKIYQ